jgi:hypothetical protein
MNELVTIDTSITEGDSSETIKTAIALLKKDGDDLVISDLETLKVSSSLRSQVKTVQKELDEKLKSVTSPAKKIIKKIETFFKLFTSELDDLDDRIEQKQIIYQNEQEAIQKKALEEQAAKDAEALKKGEVPLPAAPTIQPEKSVRTEEGLTSFSKVWIGIVEDPMKVPREYLMVNETAIRQAVQNGIRTISGVKIIQETRTSRR